MLGLFTQNRIFVTSAKCTYLNLTDTFTISIIYKLYNMRTRIDSCGTQQNIILWTEN